MFARCLFLLLVAMLGSEASSAATSPPETPAVAIVPAEPALTLDGRAITAEELQGKVVLLSFASDSCIPCRDAAPMLGRLESRWSQKPFLLLTIGNDRQERELRRLIAESGLPWQGVWTWRQEVVAKENERRISEQISSALRWVKKGKAKS
jgi:thiol-disulfide isomerase/thioredoxin